MLVSEGHAREWMEKVGWTKPFDDFSKQKPADQTEAVKPAKELQNSLLEVFPKIGGKIFKDWRKIQWTQ